MKSRWKVPFNPAEDLGNRFIHDDKGNADKAERETRAADRLYGLLPPDQEDELKSLWLEYEAREPAWEIRTVR